MKQEDPNLPSDLLRIEQVSQMTSLSKSCIRLWVAQGRFPKPLKLSKNLKPFVGQEIRTWIKDRSEEGR